MRLHRCFLLSVVAAASVTLLAVACGGNYSESTPAGPSAVGGTALSVGGTALGGGTVSLAAKAPKVDVCHTTGDGSFQLLNVNGNALSAHLAHGDGIPGDGEFDENCDPVPVNACPYFSRADLDAIDWIGGGFLFCEAVEVPDALSYASISNDTHQVFMTGEGGGDENFANSCVVQDATTSVETGIYADSVPACFGLLVAKIQDLAACGYSAFHDCVALP